eukprot:141717_1
MANYVRNSFGNTNNEETELAIGAEHENAISNFSLHVSGKEPNTVVVTFHTPRQSKATYQLFTKTDHGNSAPFGMAFKDPVPGMSEADFNVEGDFLNGAESMFLVSETKISDAVPTPPELISFTFTMANGNSRGVLKLTSGLFFDDKTYFELKTAENEDPEDDIEIKSFTGRFASNGQIEFDMDLELLNELQNIVRVRLRATKHFADQKWSTVSSESYGEIQFNEQNEDNVDDA